MRATAEIVAMRDLIGRRELGYDPAEMNDVVFAVLQWVCDPSRSDGELLDVAETGLRKDPTSLDALEALAAADPDWNAAKDYLTSMPLEKVERLRRLGRRLVDAARELTKTEAPV